MSHYLISVHSPAARSCEPPPGAAADSEAMQEMQAMMARIQELEDDMRAQGAWTFSGRLTSVDSATVVRDRGGEILTTDGPFAEAKEHIAGFYVVDAKDLDEALAWAAKVTRCIGQPVEVRPFAGLQR